MHLTRAVGQLLEKKQTYVKKKDKGQKKDFNHLDGGKPGVHYTWHDRNEPRVRKWTWAGPGSFSGSRNKRAPTQQSTKSPSFCPLLVASGLLLQKHKLLLAPSPSLSLSSVSQFFCCDSHAKIALARLRESLLQSPHFQKEILLFFPIPQFVFIVFDFLFCVVSWPLKSYRSSDLCVSGSLTVKLFSSD
jgi:hypothetical protein